jgi:hypothetical protein
VDGAAGGAREAAGLTRGRSPELRVDLRVAQEARRSQGGAPERPRGDAARPAQGARRVESELDLREAPLTADVEIRTDKLEEREQALAELQERLANQERELGEYVAKAQTEIQRRESEWWKQQLGEGASAA